MDFLKNRFIYLLICGVFTFISLIALIFGKYNLSIDMTGGISMEYSYGNSIVIDDIKTTLTQEAESYTNNGNKVINSISVYSITGEKAFSVVAGFDSQVDEKTLDKLKTDFRSKTLTILQEKDNTIKETRYVNIGKTFGDYIKNTALLTLGLATIAITIYVAYAFSGIAGGVSVISFPLITLTTLMHDIVVSSGIYVIIGYAFKDLQVDTFFITALLTILGYSINNTIVVFDRVRLNLKEFAGKPGKKGKELYEIINMSIQATITRSIYTSLTVLFVLITILLFGPESLSGFIIVMILGTTIGTFSSILVAPSLLYEINKNKKLTAYVKKVERIEDKIVV